MIGLLRTARQDIRPLGFVVLTLTAITLSIASARASEDWNPKPNSDDVILPLPCGQSMVFRRIITHNAVQGAPTEILEDRRIRLGSPDIDKAYLDYLRSGFIAGHFRSEGKRFYLLGKYETTRAQFKSLMSGGDCSVNDGDTFTPVGRLSWHDTAAFSRLLTQHLLKEARTEINSATGTTRVHARAPTEAEWEFAARGGIAVSIAEFQNPRFPMQHDLRAYAWLNDPLTARNEMAPIGAVLPNPLGLYDMYGNAAEIMVEPFRLNKAGRSHGLAGGVILKGGSFQTNPTFVNSSAREEIALFDAETGEERRQRTNGLRVALVGLALPDGYAVDTLAREWRQASESTISQEQDPLLLISELRDSQLDLQLKNNLDTIEQVIREGISAGTDDRSQLLNGLLVGLGRVHDSRQNDLPVWAVWACKRPLWAGSPPSLESLFRIIQYPASENIEPDPKP